MSPLIGRSSKSFRHTANRQTRAARHAPFTEFLHRSHEHDTNRYGNHSATVHTRFLEAVKTKQQATWASGDFGHIGVRLQIVGESLCEAVDLQAGERVLDVAAGNGNASLAAARRFADVTSTDYVPALLEQGRTRADADWLAIAFQVADAENLPFPDAGFDVVLSTYGVMFAPNQKRAAAELLRVVKPGGRIGLANWTPRASSAGCSR